MTTRCYTTLRGLFLQDEPESEAGAIPPRFGLKDESNARWVKFKEEIDRLNASASPGVQYKVAFLGRHGEGFHNVAMQKYTAEEWLRQALITVRCMTPPFTPHRVSWTKLNGNGELVWGPDPKLTPLGIEQARDAHRAWKMELEFGIPLPERLYSSPLSRAIKTSQVTFEGLLRPGLKTTVIENAREKIGVSTCDKRRKKSEIARDFPDYPFEPGFTEEDEAWAPDIRETCEGLDTRAKKMLDMIFDNDQEHFISITSHHGFIDAFLRVCEHRPWGLPTGGVIPIVLKAEQRLLLN